MSSTTFDQAAVRVGSCARTLLADAQTLRQVATSVAETNGYREEYRVQARVEAEKAEAAFKLVKKAFDVLAGGKR